jgi:DNA-binding transcriptional MerR regulator
MEKSREAFRTISEVAEWLQTPAHVLRFWESKFSQVKPVKRAGGRRYYRPADMLLLGGIKRLLHEDGMTIKGVQKILREQGVRHVASLSSHALEDADALIGEDADSATSDSAAQAAPAYSATTAVAEDASQAPAEHAAAESAQESEQPASDTTGEPAQQPEADAHGAAHGAEPASGEANEPAAVSGGATPPDSAIETPLEDAPDDGSGWKLEDALPDFGAQVARQDTSEASDVAEAEVAEAEIEPEGAENPGLTESVGDTVPLPDSEADASTDPAVETGDAPDLPEASRLTPVEPPEAAGTWADTPEDTESAATPQAPEPAHIDAAEDAHPDDADPDVPEAPPSETDSPELDLSGSALMPEPEPGPPIAEPVSTARVSSVPVPPSGPGLLQAALDAEHADPASLAKALPALRALHQRLSQNDRP